ncbi:MAG: FAD-linked oxidase C-terminal domain-containing protein [Caldilineaceae bacterium]
MSNRLPTHPFSKTQLLTSPVELLTYEVDAGFDRGKPDGVFLPESTADVVKLVNLMREHQVPLIARGAGTGLSGGAVAEHGGVIVNFARMNRVLAFDPAGRSAQVEPGLVNLKFDGQVKTHGLYYPPDPSSQRSSVIGGNIGMNAGGPHCFKYGVTTNYVTGLEAVLIDGNVLHTGGATLDYPEYDFTGILVGSEGTLAIVTRADLRLIRNPLAVKTMMVSFDSDEAAGTAVSAIIAAGLVPAALEMMDQKVMGMIEDFAHCGLPVEAQAGLIVEVDGYPESLDIQMEEIADILTEHKGYNLRIARSEAERQQIWYGRKSAAGAFSRLSPAFYLVDITVRRSLLAEMLHEVNLISDKNRVRTGHVFHAGDGNLHPAILCDPRDEALMQRVFATCDEIVQLCIEKGGSITGEHGVGIEKRKYMPKMYNGSELSAMLDLKAIFDPQGLLNPGKIFPADLPAPSYEAPILPKGDIFAPQSAQEAAANLRALGEAGKKIQVCSAPKEIRNSLTLSTAKLTGIHEFAPHDLFITVGAGTPLAEVQRFLVEHKMQLTLASPWAEQSIGSLVASNLNSPQRVRYGAIRDNLLATTVALADGRVIRAGRSVVKNVAGYDLPKLFVGSYGTLGVLCDVTLKLTPAPRARKTLAIPLTTLNASVALAEKLLPHLAIASGLVLCQGAQGQDLPNADFTLFYTAEGLPEDVDAELAEVAGAWGLLDGRLPLRVESHSALSIWQEFLQKTTTDELLVRVAVPVGKLGSYLASPAVNGHDGSIWLTDVANGMAYVRYAPVASNDARRWLEAIRVPALRLGGYALVMQAPTTWEGEIDRWGYTPESLALMHQLKQKWDPKAVLTSAFSVSQE